MVELLSKKDFIDYAVYSRDVTVQYFLQTVGQEGVFQLYRSGGYKRLGKDLLYGVYVVLLQNIKLNREYRKTGNEMVDFIKNYNDRILYKCLVNTTDDVLNYGNIKWKEFLEHLARVYVTEYKATEPNDKLSPETIKLRNLNNMPINRDDVFDILAFLRHSYGRYSGREEFNCLVNAIMAGFYDGFIGGVPDNVREWGYMIDFTVNSWNYRVEFLSSNRMKYTGFTRGDKLATTAVWVYQRDKKR